MDGHQIFTKRIVGAPGDHLRIANKQVIRNGAPLPESYAVHKTDYIDAFRDNFPAPPNVKLASLGQDMLDRHVKDGEVVVPAGHYFVLGDNRDNSLDSRYWGFVSRDSIVGSPIVVYGSYDGSPSIFHTRWRRLLEVL
jgi:signal peptidase I